MFSLRVEGTQIIVLIHSAAKTKPPSTRHLFLKVLEAGKSKVRVLALVSAAGLLLFLHAVGDRARRDKTLHPEVPEERRTASSPALSGDIDSLRRAEPSSLNRAASQ